MFREDMQRVYQILFLVFILGSFVFGQNSNCPNSGTQSLTEQREAAHLNEKGVSFAKTQEFNKALEVFEIAVKLYPNDAQSWSNLGVIYSIALNQPQEAILHFNKAICLNPNLLSVHYYLGKTYLRLKKFDKAIPLLHKAIVDEANRTEIFNSLAVAYLGNKKYEKAIEILQNALEKSPLNYDLINNLGFAQFHLKKFEQSAVSFQRAIAIDPKQPNAQYNLGVVYLRLNKKEDALKQYEILRTVDANNSKLLYQGIYGDKVLFLSEK